MQTHPVSRRRFLGATSTVAAAVTIVPRQVLGGAGQVAPSDTITYALIGNGGRKDAGMKRWKTCRRIAICDVDAARIGGEPDNQTRFIDYRRLLEKKDLDAVCIATPPHWHALICIAAAQAGKDIFCEKPLTKFIAEGRAIVEAVRRYGRVFQIGTFGRFDASQKPPNIENHKIIKHGLLKDLSDVVASAGARNRVGQTALPEGEIPPSLDYELWLGPAPFKPYNAARVHYQNRFYWDYEGGDLTNFGAHSVDPFQWIYAKDDTSPVAVEPGPGPWPQHPDAVGAFSWVELTYADGLRLLLTGGAAKAPYDRPRKKSMVSAKDLDEAGRQQLAALSDPPPLVEFDEAIRTRQQAGGHAESSHRVCALMHLANIAIRLGRKLRYDPVREQILGDEEANRLVNIPLRAPWHL